MTLSEKTQKDLVEAMKAKDEARITALRLLKTAIARFEVAGEKKKEASDEEILQIIAKEVKQRKESIEAFKKGGREDLVKKEEAEMKVLLKYLPEQLSEEELRKIVEEALKETSAASKADFGKVMGAVMAKVKGKAEGAMVSKIVSEFLNNLNKETPETSG